MSDFRHFVLRANTDQGLREFECTPDNTELYIHHPQYKDVDHIFHRIDDSDRRLGGFVWRHILGEEAFNEHTNRMIQSMNWCVFFRPEPTEVDMAQFTHDFVGIPDELPDDF